MSKIKKSHFIPAVAVILAGCGSDSYEFDSDWHISAERVAEESPKAPSSIPDLVGNTAALPNLEYGGSSDVYDVVVENADVRLVLNQFADQARLNIDIDPFVGGLISMNAYGQTIDQILERIRAQMPLRFEKVGNSLVVMRDEPYFKQYVVDFPYISRTWESSSDAGLTSTGSGSIGSSSLTTSQEGSGSFWGSLEEAVQSIILSAFRSEGAPTLPVGIGEEEQDRSEQLANRELDGQGGSFVTMVPEAGLVIVFASSESHKEIAQFLSTYSSVAKRQVQLQATVVEVQLNNTYQQGIDWSLFNNFSNSPKLVQSASSFFLPVTSSGGAAPVGRGVLSRLAVNGFVNWFSREENRVSKGGHADDRLFGVEGDEEASEDVLDNFDAAAKFREYAAEVNSGSDRSKHINQRLVDVISGNIEREGVGGVTGASIDDLFAQDEAALAESGRSSLQGGNGFLTGTFSHGTLRAAVSLLDRFGDTRIVSSPRISTLNGQGALLKVIRDQVYFSITQTTEEEEDEITQTTEVEEEIVPVGFAMSVFPQISSDGTIILSLRPSLTRVVGFANSGGEGDEVLQNVPIISVKEAESLMLINDGETAVLGGLIEDVQEDNDTQVPGLGDLPGLGNLFKNVDQSSRRVEYVIFVSADVIKNPSLHGDYSDYKQYLPSDEVFDRDNTGTVFGSGRTRSVPRNR